MRCVDFCTHKEKVIDLLHRQVKPNVLSRECCNETPMISSLTLGLELTESWQIDEIDWNDSGSK